MTVQSCIPVIPSADLVKSLRFWVEGLGFTIDREMTHEGKLIGCMVHNGRDLRFWLNQRAGTAVEPEDYEGIRLYWAPSDIHDMRERLKQLGVRSLRSPRARLWTDRLLRYRRRRLLALFWRCNGAVADLL
jgi:hypothetical protein